MNNPIAYAAVAADGSESIYVSALREQAEEACREYGWTLVPLYAAPTLSDEERWALEYARNACRIVATPLGVGDEGRADAHARVITKLIEKLCGGDR